jgi:alcohol-forming fatty acyl-CoA reductase
MNPQYIADNEQ